MVVSNFVDAHFVISDSSILFWRISLQNGFFATGFRRLALSVRSLSATNGTKPLKRYSWRVFIATPVTFQHDIVVFSVPGPLYILPGAFRAATILSWFECLELLPTLRARLVGGVGIFAFHKDRLTFECDTKCHFKRDYFYWYVFFL
jgi:hypothetical protein